VLKAASGSIRPFRQKKSQTNEFGIEATLRVARLSNNASDMVSFSWRWIRYSENAFPAHSRVFNHPCRLK
jgi:hypothetical protein